MTAIDVAKIWLGQKETKGPNRSPFIDRINRAVGVPLGSPWCASFVTFCFTDAGREKPEWASAGSQAIMRWFKKNKRFSTSAQDILKWKGALFGWTNADKIHGHIGIVRARFTTDGKIVAIGTLEGNTNDGGSRNGDGAYALRRGVPVDGSKRLWFLNTTGLPGGDWWNV